MLDNEGWSLYGAPWLQPVATGGKWRGREDRSNRRKPLPWVATGCLSRSMVRVHPLSEREGVASLAPRERQVLRTGRPTGLDPRTLARRVRAVKTGIDRAATC